MLEFLLRAISAPLAAAALLGMTATSARAEADTLRIAKQYGLGYIQLILMEEQRLVEKHARAAGLGDVKVEWNTFRSSDVMNDALISGNLDFASLGLTGLITIWSKTRGTIDVKAASGLNAMPLVLLARGTIESLRDFNENQRIAVPAVRVSVRATLLEMAAAKEWGIENYAKLDSLTVSLAHPDATAMMLGGKSEIVANFSSPPFQYRQLKDPDIHRIASSEEILGGPVSFNVVAATARFRAQNPKLYGAFLAALREATDFVDGNREEAAEIYVKATGDKTPVNEILDIMGKPGVRFTTEVLNVGTVADFLAKVGRLKNPPADWRDMLFPEARR